MPPATPIHLPTITWSSYPHSATLIGVWRGGPGQNARWISLDASWSALRNERGQAIALQGTVSPLPDWSVLCALFHELPQWTTPEQWALWQAQWVAAATGQPIPLWLSSASPVSPSASHPKETPRTFAQAKTLP